MNEFEKHTAMQTIIDRLQQSIYNVSDNACLHCHTGKYGTKELQAGRVTQKYFDGLCLDYMNRDNPKLRDHHEDYWNHSDFRHEDGRLDHCRIRHKQSTWYHSFMGRDKDKLQLLRKHKR